MTDGFRNKVAVVTGGSDGIGLATAKLLAGRGAKVIICARRQDKLDAAAADARNDDRGAKRLVHLDDGRVLRVRARAVGGGWQIRRGRDWIDLPAAAVTRVQLERDVLRQARELERELVAGSKEDAEALGRRAAYANWLVEAGLVAEGAAELDRVLRKDPDQPQALAALEGLSLRTNLPAIDTRPDALDDSLNAFFGAASRSTTLGSELAVQQLGELSVAVPDLHPRLRTELHAPQSRRRAFAAHALRRLFPGSEVRPLLQRAILDSSEDVRQEAARALRDVGDQAVLVPVVRALGSKHAVVREQAIEAMETMGYPAAVEPLVSHLSALRSGAVQTTSSGRPPHANIFVGRQFAYVQDFDVEVAQFAAVADPIINVAIEGAVLDAAVLSTREVRIQTELASTLRALVRLTGQQPGDSVPAWQEWWAEHGAAWKAGSPPGPPATPDRPDR